jgi:hypothetical protein
MGLQPVGGCHNLCRPPIKILLPDVQREGLPIVTGPNHAGAETRQYTGKGIVVLMTVNQVYLAAGDDLP